jgi:hypothetical protein
MITFVKNNGTELLMVAQVLYGVPLQMISRQHAINMIFVIGSHTDRAGATLLTSVELAMSHLKLTW